MKVLSVISDLETGGAQKLVGDLLPLIARQPNIKVRLLTFRLKDSFIEKSIRDAGIPITDLDCNARSPISIIKIIPFLKWADVIHVHLFPANYITAIGNLLSGKPLVFTEHNTHNRRRNHRFLRPIEKWIYSRFSSVVCVSDSVRQALSLWTDEKLSSTRYITIRNGIDISKYSSCKPQDSEKIFGRKGRAVLMVSRFSDSKDQPTLLRALTMIEDKDIFAVFVGDGWKRKETERLAKDLGVSQRAIFLGTRSDVAEIIKASSIGVQSSNWEGFGLTAVEMMAGGLPVIASDVDGLRNVTEGAGLIFKTGDETELACKIKLILSDPRLREKLSKTGIERANEYSIEKTAAEHIRLYHGLVENKTTTGNKSRLQSVD